MQWLVKLILPMVVEALIKWISKPGNLKGVMLDGLDAVDDISNKADNPLVPEKVKTITDATRDALDDLA